MSAHRPSPRPERWLMGARRPRRLPAGSGSDESATPQCQKVAAVIKGLDNPFFQTMEQGIDEQAKADGVAVDGPGGQPPSPTPPARPTSSTPWPGRTSPATSSTRSPAPT